MPYILGSKTIFRCRLGRVDKVIRSKHGVGYRFDLHNGAYMRLEEVRKLKRALEKELMAEGIISDHVTYSKKYYREHPEKFREYRAKAREKS